MAAHALRARREARAGRPLGFRCPVCRSDEIGVRDSRPTASGIVRRRRYCDNCATRFTTYEVGEEIYRAIDVMGPKNRAREALNEFVAKFNELNRAINDSAKRTREGNEA